MIKGPKKAVSVTMPLELYERLKTLAEETGRTPSGYIRQILKGYLWHLENCPETMEDWPIVREFCRDHPSDRETGES